MIVSNTPPPSKYWSTDQKTWYDICLKDKNCTLAYYLTTKDGFPLYSPNKKGWRVRSGLVQEVHPSNGQIIPCSANALHATFDVKSWAVLNCKIWVVAMVGKIVEEQNKICALKRRIIGAYRPNDLSNEARLISFPDDNLNQKYKTFHGLNLKFRPDDLFDNKISNINFSSSTFSKCSFHDIVFNKCNFENVEFQECKFNWCTFKNCTFDPTYCYDDSTLIGTKIIGDAVGLYWPKGQEPPVGFQVKNGILINSQKGK